MIPLKIHLIYLRGDTSASSISFEFLDRPRYKLLSSFLASAIYTHDLAVWFLDTIDLVIIRGSLCEEKAGEAYGVKIMADTSIVYNVFDESDNLEIDTSELKEIITFWIKELLEFRRDPIAYEVKLRGQNSLDI